MDDYGYRIWGSEKIGRGVDSHALDLQLYPRGPVCEVADAPLPLNAPVVHEQYTITIVYPWLS